MTVLQANDWQELDRLIDGLCDQTLSADERTRLGQWLVGHVEARDHYLDCLELHGRVAWQMMPGKPLSPAELRQYGGAECERLPSEGRRSPANQPPKPPVVRLPGTFDFTFGYFSSEWPVAHLASLVICSLGLLVLYFIPVHHAVQLARKSVDSPSSAPSASRPSPLAPSSSEFPPMVGQITGMVDCKWSDPQTEASNGASVPLGRKYALSSGLMQITYDTGAKVILQGPCTYQVESETGGYLSVGKLTARVEKGPRPKVQGPRTAEVTSGQWSVVSGRKPEIQNPKSKIPSPQPLAPSPSSVPSPLSPLHSPLFTITTPTVTVTDLGTEFGVEVDHRGNTTSHVYRGSVSLQATLSDGKARGTARVLRENESAHVECGKEQDEGQMTVVAAPAKPTDFVRNLPKQALKTVKTLDLVDVAAGGDGFSGRRDCFLKPTPDYPTNPEEPWRVTGDYCYHRVDGMPLIDGMFIPDGAKGPVQLDSAGHRFDRFGPTENCTCFGLWAGGGVPDDPRGSTKLGGIDYASPGHGILSMYANQGVTFDLNAVRQANPGYRIVRFRAILANIGPDSLADFWVFVDGQVRKQCREFNSFNGAFPVVIPIHAEDRFLTLVTTDGGKELRGAWAIFGDPRLDLTPDTTLSRSDSFSQ